MTTEELHAKMVAARERYNKPPVGGAAETIGAALDRGVPDDDGKLLRVVPRATLASREELARSVPRPEPRVIAPAVPPRYQSARWATWEPKGRSVEAARNVVEGWVAMVAAGTPSMIALVGPKGTSKSHMLSCAAWQLFDEHRIRATFLEWFVLVDELRERDLATATRNRLRSADVLIIDECRPTSGTDFDALELAKITMYAYSHRQSVAIATNWSSLADLIGEPAEDRYTVVPIEGESARKA